MSVIAYIDSSALLKLVVQEAETSYLEADLGERDGLVVSRLAVVECRRAAARVRNTRLLQAVGDVLDSTYLIEITPAIIERAARISPARVRSLDAIHLATALSIGDPDLEVITYDDRMADAARRNGLRILQPGR